MDPQNFKFYRHRIFTFCSEAYCRSMALGHHMCTHPKSRLCKNIEALQNAHHKVEIVRYMLRHAAAIALIFYLISTAAFEIIIFLNRRAVGQLSQSFSAPMVLDRKYHFQNAILCLRICKLSSKCYLSGKFREMAIAKPQLNMLSNLSDDNMP